MDKQSKEELSTVLYYADRMKYRIPPIGSIFADYTEQDGYDIQELLIERYRRNGYTLSGLKAGGIGYCSSAKGGFPPHYGEILTHKIIPSGSVISISDYLSPGVEAEISVTLKENVTCGPVTAEDILPLIGSVFPSWELVESREERKGKTMKDSLADNAAFGACIPGEPATAIPGYDIPIGVKVYTDGSETDILCGSATLRQIAEAVAWLANARLRRGKGIPAGEIIMAGAMTKPLIFLEPGKKYTASFDIIGEATINTKEEET